MYSLKRKLKRLANNVGLTVEGPYADRTYSLWDGSAFLGQGTPTQIESEIRKHAGIPRIAHARRHRL